MRHEDVLDQFALGLSSMAPEARLAVETEVRAAILSTNAGTILTFRTASGKELKPSATPDYAGALWCFLRQKQFNGEDLESAVNEPIVQAVQQALVSVLAREQTAGVMLAPVRVTGISGSVDDAAREMGRQDLDWLRREFMAAANLPGAETIQSHVTALAAHNAAAFFKTAAGTAVLKSVAVVASTAAGKILIAKLLSTAAAKVAASTLLKGMLLAFIKKVGLVLLIKTVLVGGLGAAIGVDRLRNVPPQLVIGAIVVVLGGFLTYEVWNMPKRLAKDLPGQIGGKIGEEWPEISRVFSAAILQQAFVDLTSQPSA